MTAQKSPVLTSFISCLEWKYGHSIEWGSDPVLSRSDFEFSIQFQEPDQVYILHKVSSHYFVRIRLKNWFFFISVQKSFLTTRVDYSLILQYAFMIIIMTLSSALN